MRSAALLLLALAGCAPGCAPQPQPFQFQCDDHGLIIANRLTGDAELEALMRNAHLIDLRDRANAGERWIDPMRLMKAEGCP